MLEGPPVTNPGSLMSTTGLAPPDVDDDHLFDAFTNPTCRLQISWCYTGINDKSDAELIS
jgi:hypothetical protein